MPFIKKLPKYVLRRPNGLYQYKRNVPKHLVKKVGKGTLYRGLGHSYLEMIKNLPIVHKEIEGLYRSVEAETSRERTLAIVKSNFGTEASEMLAAGEVDSNLDAGLFDLSHKLEDEVDPEVFSHLLGASVPEEVVTLSKAFDLYGDFKDAKENKKLQNSLNKTQEDLIKALGGVKITGLSLEKITRGDANKYRDTLLERVSPNSVTRYINIVRAVINYAIAELGLQIVNPFHNLKVKGAGNTAGDRLSLSREEADSVLVVLPQQGDLRAIYTTLRDTGARLAEISGLRSGDINLQEKFLFIRPNSYRSLKTESSVRVIPLSEAALELLQVCKHGKDDEQPLFSKYGRSGGNTACSATLMKHFRKVIKEPKKSLHSLRHSKKDALRWTNCPDEISKVILGHSTQEVAARYGDGYKVETLREHLEKTW